ncbi:hypothetical protein B296_00019761 [Ensete ventricosum]|uniref:Uncharacterized protein n=1 Tax=Ensete ventricosum TaxID=4639 RepID=A0A426XJR4_ENSVE|nr:hypothetical protein B296_00019761 [Ensete ventricosum]
MHDTHRASQPYVTPVDATDKELSKWGPLGLTWFANRREADMARGGGPPMSICTPKPSVLEKRKDRVPSDPISTQSQSKAEPRLRPSPVARRRRGGPGQAGYAEVSYLLKSDAAHIPGVVNPTQLARWLQM